MIQHLYAPFNLKKRKGLGGMTFDYISSDDVIDRMNRTFSGAWRTEVITEDRVDDSVLVRVRVHVYDPATKIEFFHDGYGSSVIARYSSGQNKGNIIDLGNAYKSAESMAIRNACTRFGVGLYLKEEDGFKVETQSSSKEQDPVGTERKEVVEQEVIKKVPMPPTVSEVPSSPTVPKVPLPPTKEEVKKFTLPTIPGKKIANNTGPNLPKIPSVENTPPPITKMKSVEAPVSNTAISNGDSQISDVQKAAIEGILALKRLEFPELVSGTFEHNGLDKTLAPDNIENLSYKEAIMVIKYGNEVFRQNR